MWFSKMFTAKEVKVKSYPATFIIPIILLMASVAFAGLFGKDKIAHDKVVSDTLIITVDALDEEYSNVCFDTLHEGEMYDCHIVKTVEFLGCINESEVLRKDKPKSKPVYTPTPFSNEPKE